MLAVTAVTNTVSKFAEQRVRDGPRKRLPQRDDAGAMVCNKKPRPSLLPLPGKVGHVRSALFGSGESSVVVCPAARADVRPAASSERAPVDGPRSNSSRT